MGKILIEDTNIAEQSNWVDDAGATISEDAIHLYNRRLKVEDDSYVIQDGENDKTSIGEWIKYADTHEKDFWWTQQRIDEVRVSVTWALLSDSD